VRLWHSFRGKKQPPRPCSSLNPAADIIQGRVRHIASKAGGLGDELMTLGAVQAAVRAFPGWQCILHSRHHEFLAGSPGPQRIVPFERHGLSEIFELTYVAKDVLSLNEQMGRQLGVSGTDYPIELVKPTIADRHESAKLPNTVQVVVQCDSSGWTPNKQWPEAHWRTLIESLPREWRILEVGARTIFPGLPSHPGFLSMAGRTSLPEFAALIHAADVFIGPPSGGMHLAHAYRKPAVIIVGGFESPHYPYPAAVQLGSTVSCAPCWLRTPCPYDRRCLREITPAQVLAAVAAQLAVALPKPR